MLLNWSALGVKWPKGQVFRRELMGNVTMPNLPAGHYVSNGAGLILVHRAGFEVRNVGSFLVADWTDIEVPMWSRDSDELFLFARVSCVDLLSKTQNRQSWPFVGFKPKNHLGNPTWGFKVVVYSVLPTVEKALQFLAMTRAA